MRVTPAGGPGARIKPSTPGDRAGGLGCSEGGPAVLNALALDVTDLLLADAEAAGHLPARLRHRHLPVFSVLKLKKDLKLLPLRDGIIQG